VFTAGGGGCGSGTRGGGRSVVCAAAAG